MRLTKYIVCLVVSVLVWDEAYAQSNTFSVSPGIRFFDYAEYDDNGSFLDGEKGPVLGVGGVFAHRDANNVTLSLIADVFFGTVDYDGQLQSGFPLTTETDQLFYSLGIRVEVPVRPQDNRFSLIVDLVNQTWERDILPTSISTRLFEIYEWWELSLGAKYLVAEEKTNSLSIFARAYQIVNPTMEVDLVSEGYGQPKLDLGARIGGEIGFQQMISYTPNNQIALLGTYKFWKFGRSDDLTVVRDDGQASIIIHEPRSETNNLTLQVIFTTTF